MITRDAYETLEAALDRVLPGARDANAIRCVEWIISQRGYRDWHDTVISGIGLLDTISNGMHGMSFVLCTDGQRDSVLEVLAAVPHPRARGLLTLLIRLALMGFVGHPRYGGNLNESGWRFVGFPPREQLTDRAAAWSEKECENEAEVDLLEHLIAPR